jgi:hypothetical protein
MSSKLCRLLVIALPIGFSSFANKVSACSANPLLLNKDKIIIVAAIANLFLIFF